MGRVYEHLLKPAIIAAGYQPVRADDAVKTDYIVVGIIQKIVESEMVLCDYSSRNPNVMYKLGIRHAFNKPVVLIKDRKTEKIFDIQGLRYTEYDESLRIDTYFAVHDDHVLFSDGSSYSVGTDLFKSGKEIGKIVQIDSKRQTIRLKTKSGVFQNLNRYSPSSAGLTDLPF